MAKNTTVTKISMNVDFRIVSAALLVAIAIMLFIWKPWSAPANAGRTVEVTGQTTVSARPDEFVFYPSYMVENNDREAAITELTTKTDTIVVALKKLGVKESKIKVDASGYNNDLYNPKSDGATTYTSQLTVTVNDEKLAQKVQDYLVTTAPTGSVTPVAGFSEAKSKELESKARNAAAVDARSKAEQMGKNLGFKLGKVKTITDGGGFGGYLPAISRYQTTDMAASSDGKTAASLGLQPGENDLPYSVTVTYFIR